jgi:hypothetical protein
MPKVGEKGQKSLGEVRESWGMALKIEEEGLKLAKVEAEKDYDLIERNSAKRMVQNSDFYGPGTHNWSNFGFLFGDYYYADYISK